eukprot:4071713-Pyramimonas_sp.AAC.1
MAVGGGFVAVGPSRHSREDSILEAILYERHVLVSSPSDWSGTTAHYGVAIAVWERSEEGAADVSKGWAQACSISGYHTRFAPSPRHSAALANFGHGVCECVRAATRRRTCREEEKREKVGNWTLQGEERGWVGWGGVRTLAVTGIVTYAVTGIGGAVK